jgi:hypothetical protein
MLYIIEREYVGPNQDQHADDGHYIIIQNVPGRTNSSHEERTDGWLGTTNDWAEYARGEYETIEAAHAAIEARFGTCRLDADNDEVRYDDDVAEVWRVGEFAQMSREETSDWIYSGLQADVTADTTDERLEALIEEYEAEIRSEGYTLDARAIDMAKEYRDELIEKRDEAEDD